MSVLRDESVLDNIDVSESMESDRDDDDDSGREGGGKGLKISDAEIVPI